MTIRVLLVDDQELVRAGFRMLLESWDGIEVAGEAGDGRAAIELLERIDVDVVLMDVRMPGMGGVEATRLIRAGDGEHAPKVIILTTFDLDEHAYDALQAGASGFLLKDTPIADVVAAIEHVHHGDAVVAPTTTRRLLEHFTRARPPVGSPWELDERLARLTPREREVLVLLARGLSNAEIAEQLVVAAGTVKVHVGRILAKLGARDRVQAVVIAYERGVVGDAGVG